MTDIPGLHWADWVVFGAMIIASLAIGIFLFFLKNSFVEKNILKSVK